MGLLSSPTPAAAPTVQCRNKLTSLDKSPKPRDSNPTHVSSSTIGKDWEGINLGSIPNDQCHPKKIPKFHLKGGLVQFCPQSLETQTSHTYHRPQQLPAHYPPTLDHNILVFLTNGLHPCYKIVKNGVHEKKNNWFIFMAHQK